MYSGVDINCTHLANLQPSRKICRRHKVYQVSLHVVATIKRQRKESAQPQRHSNTKKNTYDVPCLPTYLPTDRYQSNMYHSFQAILLFLATLAVASIRNPDILFFLKPGSCSRDDDWVYCSNITAGFCCQAQGPFCPRLSCDHCGGKALAAFQDKSSCAGLDQADASCTPSSGGTCCLDAGSKSVCAGSYCKYCLCLTGRYVVADTRHRRFEHQGPEC